jgi:hypothetical protein
VNHLSRKRSREAVKRRIFEKRIYTQFVTQQLEAITAIYGGPPVWGIALAVVIPFILCAIGVYLHI